MAATLALFGSTVLSAARYFVGSWFPSLEQLMYNKVRLAGMHTPASTQDFCRQQMPSIAHFEHSTPSTPSI